LLTTRKLDTDYTVETPEAIDLNTQLGGPVARILAYAIDLSIRSAILLALLITLVLLGKTGLGFFFLISFLFEWFYPLFFEIYFQGQTPGKKFLGLKVVNEDLTPVTFSASALRNLLRSVDFLPFGYLFGIACMAINRNFQRLGDLAASTLVVHVENTPTRFNLPEVKSQIPTTSLSLRDQIAFTEFSQRQAGLSEQRKHELANLLTDFNPEIKGKNLDYILGIGCWLLGKRS